MRFTINIELGDEYSGKVSIPSSYRKNIASLIKEALKNQGAYEKYYGDPKTNKMKPFTFALALSVNKIEQDRLILNNNTLQLIFSSFDLPFAITAYTGLLSLSKTDFTVFQPYKMKLQSLYAQKFKLIRNEETFFKTLSPILVRDIKNRKGKGFIDFQHPDFEKNLFFSIKTLCNAFIDPDYSLLPEQIAIEKVKCRSHVIRNYGGEIGTSGYLKIRAPLSVLQLIYYAGLGARRSQGFGLLEEKEVN